MNIVPTSCKVHSHSTYSTQSKQLQLSAWDFRNLLDFAPFWARAMNERVKNVEWSWDEIHGYIPIIIFHAQPDNDNPSVTMQTS